MNFQHDEEVSFPAENDFRYDEADVKNIKDENIMWNILPSYDMYTSSVGKPLHEGPIPPDYDASSSITSPHMSDYGSSSLSFRQSNSNTNNSSTDNNNNANITIYEGVQSWKSSILDNIHYLRNMTDSDNFFSRNIKIDIHLTKDIGKVGEVPTPVNANQVEYQNGDLVNGYILINNTTKEPIDFTFFYVVFEGIFMINQNGQSKTKRVKKFIEMFDFAGSYNSLHINRLVTEYDGPFNWGPNACPFVPDKVDNTYGVMPGRKIPPDKTIKRFFSFKIPNNLLDIECDDNSYNHLQLPPTMGDKHIKDFSFNNTIIDYSVLARFIGKDALYNFNTNKGLDTKVVNDEGDEYVIFKDAKQSVRVVPFSFPPITSHPIIHYNNFIDVIDQKINMGEKIKQASHQKSNNDLSALIASFEDQLNPDKNVKLKQLYQRSRDNKQQPKPQTYNIDYLLKEKKIFNPKRYPLVVSTPKTTYRIPYKPPVTHNRVQKKLNGNIEIPITLMFSNKPVAIKRIRCEVIALTLESRNSSIPFEFNQDMLFSNKNVKIKDFYRDNDNFTTLIKQPCEAKLTQLKNLSKDIDISSCQIPKDLIDLLKVLSSIHEKYNSFKVNTWSLSQNNQILKQANELSIINDNNCCNFTLNLDLHDLSHITIDKNNPPPIALVPCFQSCYMCRFYYVRILITFANDEIIAFKVPLSIDNLSD